MVLAASGFRPTLCAKVRESDLPGREQYDPNSQTLVIESQDFCFDTLTIENGFAKAICFVLHNPEVKPGDVLLVLSGSEILFHGLIGQIGDGEATAIDRRSRSHRPLSIECAILSRL